MQQDMEQKEIEQIAGNQSRLENGEWDEEDEKVAAEEGEEL